MKVSQRMTRNPVTVTPETTHREALNLLKEHNIRRLPVVSDSGALVGIVTELDLLSNAPSQATSLSVYEIYTLLDKLKVKQMMATPVYAVAENCGISAAARFMIDHKYGSLPVVDANGKLTGIITETDIFKIFVEALGGGLDGLRIDVTVPDKPGQLAQIAQAVADAGGNIISLATFEHPDAERGELAIKEQGADEAVVSANLNAVSDVEIVNITPANLDRLLEFK